MFFKIFFGVILAVAIATRIEAGSVITFGKQTMVVFPHKQHQKSLGGCTECHGANDPGKIASFNEKWAHTTCVGCHNESKTGPIECAGCHSQF